ncbi:MAG TPA: hypothetical protein DCR93_23055, partial [Cytophagales bacterium]|nr:hypothetical protein [Cytophagales bacterium]
LQSLANLTEGTWEVDTTFANGERFHQRKNFISALNGHALTTQTKGTVDMETQEFGLRNEGMIVYRAADDTIVFMEADVFGGVTEGTVTIEGKDIYFDYPYQGGKFRDAWIWVNRDEYRYEIRAWQDGEYSQVYLAAPMIRLEATAFEAEYR